MVRVAPSMTAGAIRNALLGVPDDVEVRISNNVGDLPLEPIFRARNARVATNVDHETVEILRASDNVGGKACLILCLSP